MRPRLEYASKVIVSFSLYKLYSNVFSSFFPVSMHDGTREPALFAMHFFLIVFPYCASKKRFRPTSSNPGRAKALEALAPVLPNR